MQYKYEHFINGLTNCPPEQYENLAFTAYRFVFAEMDHKNNFLPVLEINPKRLNSTEFVREYAKCLGYALSLFNSVENAQRRYRQISRYNKNFYKSVGTHLAVGEIVETDGVASLADEEGHISLHEYMQTELRSKFRIMLRIV